MLLHGSGTDTSVWAGDVVAWSPHFRVHAVDLIGEPGLSAPSRPPLDSDAIALWLDDVFLGLGLDHAAVVGMSLGGWIALDHALRRPGRITQLVLLCPGGIGRQTRGRVAATSLFALLGPWGRRRSAATVSGLPFDSPILDDVVATFGSFRPRTEKLPVFGDDALRSLGMPTLVVVGARDVMFDSADTARRVRATVPAADVRVLPESGHAVLGQTDTILGFLRGR